MSEKRDFKVRPVTPEELGLTEQEMEDMVEMAKFMYPELAGEAEEDEETFSSEDLDKD